MKQHHLGKVAILAVALLGLLSAGLQAQPAGKAGAKKAGTEKAGAAAKPPATLETDKKETAKTNMEARPAEPSTSKADPVAKTLNEEAAGEKDQAEASKEESVDYSALLFVFAMATFIGLGVVARVSRLLHTPLMSLTNAISAIAIVGAIIVTGTSQDRTIRVMGAVALFASMTNVVSGFLITDRMLKMFKQTRSEGK